MRKLILTGIGLVGVQSGFDDSGAIPRPGEVASQIVRHAIVLAIICELLPVSWTRG